EPGSHTAHVPEPLDDNAPFGRLDTHSAQSPLRHDPPAAPGSFGPAARATKVDRFSGHHCRLRVAHVHRGSIHDPGHHTVVGIHVRSGHIALGSQIFNQLGGVSPRNAFEFAV